MIYLIDQIIVHILIQTENYIVQYGFAKGKSTTDVGVKLVTQLLES